jgi:hypothetical protein
MTGYASDKARIQLRLMKLARAGKVTYYGTLGASLGKHPRWPGWKQILDDIRSEQKGRPDITAVLLRTEGWPGQIDGIATKGRPTPRQKLRAQTKLDQVFQRYCPGKPIPNLPKRKP